MDDLQSTVDAQKEQLARYQSRLKGELRDEIRLK